jgi:hypothetical protein
MRKLVAMILLKINIKYWNKLDLYLFNFNINLVYLFNFNINFAYVFNFDILSCAFVMLVGELDWKNRVLLSFSYL